MITVVNFSLHFSYPSTKTQVRIVNIWPHNQSAFTEGLFFHNGSLLESTGLSGKSYIRELDFHAFTLFGLNKDKNPNAIYRLPLISNEYEFPMEYFGEGISCIGDKLYSLTYKAKEIFVFSRQSLKLLDIFPFETSTGEGWGMTTDGKELIVSDGSSIISFYDPISLNQTRTIQVKGLDGKLIDQINELEFVDGEILANVWFSNNILRINPSSGDVIEVIDLHWLRNMVTNFESIDPGYLQDAVMNGIAYNPLNRHVYVTGKLWDSLFELEFSYLLT
jgi:glutamine cyclotransferase